MDKAKLITQLRRIEGQVRGIANLIDQDRGLVTTVQQISAAQSSLARVKREYIKLFLYEDGEDEVSLSREQVEYLLKLIET